MTTDLALFERGTGPKVLQPEPAPPGPSGPATAIILAALIRHYRKPGTPRDGEILVTEAESPAGGRRCDLIRVGMWRSRGSGIDGHEIKASRADWLRELDDPPKAEAWWPYCTRWWVVAPPGVVADGELPEGWGLMELPASGRRFRVKVQAARKDAKLTVALLVELLRRNDNLRLGEMDELRAKHRADFYAFERKLRADTAQATLTTSVRERLGLLERVEKALGTRLTDYSWHGGRDLRSMSADELGEALVAVGDQVAAQRRIRRGEDRERRLREAMQTLLADLDREGAATA